MPDQERVIYSYGTGPGYRVASKTFFRIRLNAIVGWLFFVGLAATGIVLHSNILFFTGCGVLLVAFAMQVGIARFGRLSDEPVFAQPSKSRLGRPFVRVFWAIFKVLMIMGAVLVSLLVWETVTTGQEFSFGHWALITVLLFGIVQWRGISSKKPNRPRAGDE
jgi:hypothetical protein